MKFYEDVRSTIFPEIQISKTKVRVPEDIREEIIFSEDGEEAVEYVYNECVYEMNEYLLQNVQMLNNMMDISLMAIDESYVENSGAIDVIMIAMDQLIMEVEALKEQNQMLKDIIKQEILEELNSKEGEEE